MKKKTFLMIAFLIGAVVFSIGYHYLEQKELNETIKETVRTYSSPAGQEAVLDTLDSVDVRSENTTASTRHYNSFAEAFNAYSELANSDDLRIVVRFNLDSDQDPTAFMEELKKHSGDTEWIEKYCKENNISVEYTIVPTK